MEDQANLPDLTDVLRAVLNGIEPAQQPLLLAALERLAADRYRIWAKLHEDPEVSRGLLVCAEREDEIATRIESLYPNAKEDQAEMLLAKPVIGRLNASLFEGRPLAEQFALQAQAEQAGADAWSRYAGDVGDDETKRVLLKCGDLEAANVAYLETLV